MLPLSTLVHTMEHVGNVRFIHEVQLHVIADFLDDAVIALGDEAAVGALEFGERKFNRL